MHRIQYKNYHTHTHTQKGLSVKFGFANEYKTLLILYNIHLPTVSVHKMIVNEKLNGKYFRSVSPKCSPTKVFLSVIFILQIFQPETLTIQHFSK